MEKEEKKSVEFELIKVSKHSDINKVAGAIAAMFKEKGYAKVRAIGVLALNQAIKSSIVARSMLASEENVGLIPSFSTVEIDGKNTSAIDIDVIKIYGGK